MTLGQKILGTLSVAWGIGSALMSPQSGIINLIAHVATAGAIVGSIYLAYRTAKYAMNQAYGMLEDSEYLDSSFDPEVDSNCSLAPEDAASLEEEQAYEYSFDESIPSAEILSLGDGIADNPSAAALGSDFDSDSKRSSNRLHNRRFH